MSGYQSGTKYRYLIISLMIHILAASGFLLFPADPEICAENYSPEYSEIKVAAFFSEKKEITGSSSSSNSSSSSSSSSPGHTAGIRENFTPDENKNLSEKQEKSLELLNQGDGSRNAAESREEAASAGDNALTGMEKVPEKSFFVKAQPVREIMPVYPLSAVRRNIEGSVIIEAVIDESGEIKKAEIAVSSGSRILDNSAVASALSADYFPAELDGEKVADILRITFNYRLNQNNQ